MKLRNKKTGEIKDFVVVVVNGYAGNDTLAEFNEEWEDYEEPKGHWYIDFDGEIDYENNIDLNRTDSIIGNYFETKEEAEKAVEKLKAWKRLKDKGAEFYGWRRNQTGTYELYLRWEDRIPRSYEIKNDLDLLFGGEE